MVEERVSVERAIELVEDSTGPLDAEAVEVMLASGRVLSERVSAWVDCPGADTSRLDGYALRSADTSPASPDSPVKLSVAGKASFTNPFEGVLSSGQCLQVFSGSVMPESADAVAAIEDVSAGEGEIELSSPVPEGNGIRPRAEEFRMGEFVAEAGIVLDPGWVGLLIASGWEEVNVIRLPRVRVIPVGDELKPPGTTLEHGQVYASAGAGITSWCRRLGVADVRMTIALDDPYDVQEAAPDPAVADFMVTLGGTGKSERDVVIGALEELGVEFIFRGISARPGHFTSYGLLQNMPVLCLPGGPSAADIMFQWKTTCPSGRPNSARTCRPGMTATGW